MLLRTILIYCSMTVCALALHEHTFVVFELREELLMRTLNLWELFDQLKYVTEEQRAIVHGEIEHIKQEIIRLIDLIVQHDNQEHP